MRTYNMVLLGTGLLLAAQTVHAQNSGANQMVDSAQQRRQMEPPAGNDDAAAPEFYPGESGDIGPQSVLQIKPNRWQLELFADEQIFYTDNMFLGNRVRHSSDVLVSTVQAAVVTPKLKVFEGDLAARAGYQHQWFMYGLLDRNQVEVVDFSHDFAKQHVMDIDVFNFNAQTVFGNVTWSRNGWVVAGGVDLRRLMDSGNYDEFYHEFGPSWGVQKTIELTSKISATLGYEGDFRFSRSLTPPAGFSTAINDRTDHSVFAMVNLSPCRYAVFQPYYRLQFSHYTGQNRDDYLNSFGLALYLPITKNAGLRTFVNYDMNSTDGQFVESYRQLDAGVGLTLSVRF